MIPTDTSIKLTKKMFMALPTGGLLVSNCMVSRNQSVFEEPVEQEGPARSRQWDRVVAARASQRLCRVFRSRDDYEAWLKAIV